MYLHLGQNSNSEIREIIGIFDLSTCRSPLFSTLPQKIKKNKIKSGILTRTSLVPSVIASTTLYKRCGDINELLHEA